MDRWVPSGPPSGKGGGNRAWKGGNKRKQYTQQQQPFAGVDRNLPSSAKEALQLCVFGLAADMQVCCKLLVLKHTLSNSVFHHLTARLPTPNAHEHRPRVIL